MTTYRHAYVILLRFVLLHLKMHASFTLIPTSKSTWSINLLVLDYFTFNILLPHMSLIFEYKAVIVHRQCLLVYILSLTWNFIWCHTNICTNHIYMMRWKFSNLWSLSSKGTCGEANSSQGACLQLFYLHGPAHRGDFHKMRSHILQSLHQGRDCYSSEVPYL